MGIRGEDGTGKKEDYFGQSSDRKNSASGADSWGKQGDAFMKVEGKDMVAALIHQLAYMRIRDTLASPELLGEGSYLEGLGALSYEDKKHL